MRGYSVTTTLLCPMALGFRLAAPAEAETHEFYPKYHSRVFSAYKELVLRVCKRRRENRPQPG